MTLQEATARAVKAVLGVSLTEYQAARSAFRAGNLQAEQWEPLKRNFEIALERRTDIIAGEVKALLAGAPVHACAVTIRKVDGAGETVGIAPCQSPATTVVAGRHYCFRHAGQAPRLPVPAAKGAA